MSRGCCYGCAERHVGCHGKCERYLAWKKEQEKINGTVEKTWVARDRFFAFHSEAKMRCARKAGKTLHERRL